MTGAGAAPLCAAINLGNRVLAARGGDGAPVGISVDLAREIGRMLGREVALCPFERAVDVADSAGEGAWDFCFLAVDPERARTIAFTEPYVRIAGCYLVSEASGAQVAGDVLSKRLRIGVVEGSAYTLHLSRQPGADRLVTMPDIYAVVAAFDRGEVDGIAGIEQAMRDIGATRAGSRVLMPPFMEIRQAMGVPAGDPALFEAIRSSLGAIARAGTLARILERHGVGPDCALLPEQIPQ